MSPPSAAGVTSPHDASRPLGQAHARGAVGVADDGDTHRADVRFCEDEGSSTAATDRRLKAKPRAHLTTEKRRRCGQQGYRRQEVLELRSPDEHSAD
jgi:hypothetical protein